MNTDEDDLYDAHCVNCGAGYHFEVGFSLACPACGRSQTATLSDIEERNEREQEHARRYDNGDVQREDMLHALYQYQSALDQLAITLDERELMVMVRELTHKTVKAKLKGLPL